MEIHNRKEEAIVKRTTFFTEAFDRIMTTKMGPILTPHNKHHSYVHEKHLKHIKETFHTVCQLIFVTLF